MLNWFGSDPINTCRIIPDSNSSWLQIGAADLVQSWWAGRVRRWWLDLSIQGRKDYKRSITTVKNWQCFSKHFLGVFYDTYVLFGPPISRSQTILMLKTYLLALLISIARQLWFLLLIIILTSCRERHCFPGNRHGQVLDWRYTHCPWLGPWDRPWLVQLRDSFCPRSSPSSSLPWCMSHRNRVDCNSRNRRASKEK